MERARNPRASVAVGALALLLCALLAAGSAGAAPFAGAELEFSGDSAELSAGQVAVPVECVGGPTGFCSGTLSLSRRGETTVSAFSVQGGSRDTVFAPLPGGTLGRRPKVAAVATTSQPLGPAITRKAILHLR